MTQTCRHCGKELVRKRFPSGLEDATRFALRKFCNRRCMAASMEGTIKILNAKNSRRQSAKRVRPTCEACGTSKRKMHVHHRDENPLNNSPSNLRTLCVSCHSRSHSPNFTETGEQRTNCAHCSNPSIKLGLCATHLTRFRRFGHPLAKKRKIGSAWVLMLHDGKEWSDFPSLMGLPSSWDLAAPTQARAARKCSAATATQSSRRSRRNL